jgi:hypothetical protein
LTFCENVDSTIIKVWWLNPLDDATAKRKTYLWGFDPAGEEFQYEKVCIGSSVCGSSVRDGVCGDNENWFRVDFRLGS